MMKKLIFAAIVVFMVACSPKTSEKDITLNDVLSLSDFEWTREPESFVIKGDTVEVVTRPGTDLWQRTYYHFRNDNAPVFQVSTA